MVYGDRSCRGAHAAPAHDIPNRPASSPAPPSSGVGGAQCSVKRCSKCCRSCSLACRWHPSRRSEWTEVPDWRASWSASFPGLPQTLASQLADHQLFQDESALAFYSRARPFVASVGATTFSTRASSHPSSRISSAEVRLTNSRSGSRPNAARSYATDRAQAGQAFPARPCSDVHSRYGGHSSFRERAGSIM